MSTILKHRRGTTAQHASFTGAVGEITVDTDKDTAVVHDGTTVGGFPLLAKTMNDGTANGVAYLNGSKVLTSGSALTFDGTRLGVGGSAVEIFDVFGTGQFRSNLKVFDAIFLQRSSGSLDLPVAAYTNGSGNILSAGTKGDIVAFGNVGGDGVIFANSNTEAMRLNSTGLGIGTSSPDSKLTVVGATAGTGAAGLRIGYNGTSVNYFDADTQYFRNGAGSNSLILAATAQQYFISGSEQMRLNSTGLGIGTSSPGYKLQVSSGATAATAYFSSTAVAAYSAAGYNGGNAKLAMFGGGASGATTGINFSQGGSFEAYFGGVQESGGAAAFVWQGYNGSAYAERMRLDASGNLGLGVTPSGWSLSGLAAMQVKNGGLYGYDLTEVGVTSNAYYGSSSWRYISSAQATRFVQVSGQHQWFTAPSGTAGNAISFTQAMTLDASGNLGLGVTPSAWGNNWKAFTIGAPGQLASTVGGNSSVQLVNAAYNDNTNWLYTYTGIPAARYQQTAGTHAFFSAPSGTAGNAISFTQAMTLDASGNLLVGTTSVVTAGSEGVQVGSGGTGQLFTARNTTSAATQIAFFNPNGNVGSVSSSGTTASYNTSSDYRLKNITGPITTSGAYIDSLNPVEGTWKADGSTFVGLIAHEVQEASRTTVATGVKDGEEMQGMDYSSAEIIANLIAEVKSLRARVAALESI